MVLTQKCCMVKPNFIYGFNAKTNFCVKTTQCINNIKHCFAFARSKFILTNSLILCCCVCNLGRRRTNNKANLRVHQSLNLSPFFPFFLQTQNFSKCFEGVKAVIVLSTQLNDIKFFKIRRIVCFCSLFMCVCCYF